MYADLTDSQTIYARVVQRYCEVFIYSISLCFRWPRKGFLSRAGGIKMCTRVIRDLYYAHAIKRRGNRTHLCYVSFWYVTRAPPIRLVRRRRRSCSSH